MARSRSHLILILGVLALVACGSSASVEVPPWLKDNALNLKERLGDSNAKISYVLGSFPIAVVHGDLTYAAHGWPVTGSTAAERYDARTHRSTILTITKGGVKETLVSLCEHFGAQCATGGPSGSGAHRLAADPSVRVPPMRVASRTTWPPYPSFPRKSCATRSTGGGMERVAPSYFVPRHGTPHQIARRVLARLGDDRYVHSVSYGHPPRAIGNRLWALLQTPAAREPADTRADPEQIVTTSLAEWEAYLVGGALRDEICAAGGRPLGGWSVPGGTASAYSDDYQPFGQRFQNPTPQLFRARLALAGRRFGFRVNSLRLLKPLQLAPLLVVEIDTDRKTFAANVPLIEHLLDPTGAFEGFFFEARDHKGPFLVTSQTLRGQERGSQWASNPTALPFPHA